MKDFNKLFKLYDNGDETIYNELNDVNFKELYAECDKNISKYYEFKNWLENTEYLMNEED